MGQRALITGIAGQDGYFLAKLLLEKGYKVFGLSNIPIRKLFPTDSLVYDKIDVKIGDLLDQKFLKQLLLDMLPDEIYHFAAQSNVGESYNNVQETYRVNTVGSIQLFELAYHLVPHAKIYFAGSSEMFGNAPDNPQSEQTPFRPKSPYGMSKVAAYYSAKYHRESCGHFIATGITFNHESERRPLDFVTQKVSYGLSKIHAGIEKKLQLGNLNTIRDWGFAGDYVEAMWLLLQQDIPMDAVIATGVGRTVEQLCNAVAHSLGMNLVWEGEGITRIARNDFGDVVIESAAEFFRESEKIPLIGNPEFITRETGWKPTTSFEQLVNRMVKHAIAAVAEQV